MNDYEQFEIDQLLAEIAEDGASRERIEKLGGLLYDRLDLQKYYLSMSGLHLLLEHEFELVQQGDGAAKMNSRRLNCHVPIESNEDWQRPAFAAAISHDRASPRQRSWLNVPKRIVGLMAGTIAATILISFAIWGSGRGRPNRQAVDSIANAELSSSTKRSDLAKNVDLVIRDSQALNLVSRLTRTAMLTSLQLPRHAETDWSEVSLCSGTAWMERGVGQHERGYVVELPAGHQFDLYVDANAGIHNSLAIIELDDQGRMTGSSSSFNNLVDGDVRSARRRWGSLGSLSEFNPTSSSKYYLLTGSHILALQTLDDEWHQSDFRVFTSSEDLLVIGWDDSGFSSSQQPTTDGFVADRDFDDIRAVMRFSTPLSASGDASLGIHYTPPPETSQFVEDRKEIGHTIDVKPFDEVVLVVSSSSSMPNRFQIIDAQSRQIIWEQTGTPLDSTRARQSTVEGSYIISNLGSTVRQYELRAQHAGNKPTSDEDWKNSAFVVRNGGDGSVTVVFANQEVKPATWAAPGVSFHARWFSASSQ